MKHTYVNRIFHPLNFSRMRLVAMLFVLLNLVNIDAFSQSDDCANAVTLIPSNQMNWVSGTTVGATQSLPGITCNGYTGFSDDDVWYKFVATAAYHVIYVQPSLDLDAIIDLRASCNSGSIACSDGPHDYTLRATGLTPGATYYIRIYSWLYGADHEGTFNICITTPPANDDCSGAFTLTPSTSCTLTTGTTTAATWSGLTFPCGGTGYDDVWYKFTAIMNPHTIQVNGVGNFDAVVELFDNCGGVSMDCADYAGFGGTETLTESNLVPGHVYYLRISGISGSGDFSVCVTYNNCSITCPSTVNVSTLSGLCDVAVSYPPVTVTGTCGNLNFSPADGSSFQVGTTPVTVTSASGQTCSFNVVVTPTPTSISTMQGPSNVCRGTTVTYCVQPVQGAVSYNWTIPSGTSGSSSTNCITLTIGPNFMSGSVIVTAFNGCNSAASAAHLIDVALAKPAKPATINPGGPVCAGTSQFFCASFVPGTENYIFSIGGNGQNAPLTLGAQNGSCITVNIPSGYNNKQELKVIAVNCMGQSQETKIDIKVLHPPTMPGNITGPAAVCHSQLGFYSIGNVNSATQYNWSVTNNVWIAGGQGTKYLALDFSTATSTAAVLSVTAQNGCGISAPRTKTISINNLCRDGSDIISENVFNSPGLKAYPNPTSGKITLEFYSDLRSNYSVKLFDMTGRIIMSRELTSIEGLNQNDFDFSELPKQIYLLKVEGENLSQTIKVGVE